MGSKPNPITCAQIDATKWYIAECDIFWGGWPATGCNRPSIGIAHDVTTGGQVKDWICNNRDCQEGWTLIFAVGDAQRLIKLFGPYIDLADAQDHMW